MVLSQECGNYGVDIPKNVWHKLESLELGSVIFECKEGAFGEHEVEGILEVKSEELGSRTRMIRIKRLLSAIWQFCSFLFVPQWGSKRRRVQEEYERMLEEGRVK